jgi:gliding motility-associated lipoprotein GldH
MTSSNQRKSVRRKILKIHPAAAAPKTLQNKMRSPKNFFYFLLLSFLVVACNDPKRIYEENIDIKDYEWSEKKALLYKFQIPDSSRKYALMYNVRYTNTYPFYNLYIKYFLLDSAGKEITQKLQGMNLFDPKTGTPYGSGVGDISDYRILGVPDFRFPYAGTYTLKVKQYMRQETLPGIVSFGIRIEDPSKE